MFFESGSDVLPHGSDGEREDAGRIGGLATLAILSGKLVFPAAYKDVYKRQVPVVPAGQSRRTTGVCLIIILFRVEC